MSISTHHYQCSWPLRFQENLHKGSISKVPFSGYPCPDSLCRGVSLINVGFHKSSREWGPIFSIGVNDSVNPDDSDEADNHESHSSEMGGVCSLLNSTHIPISWYYEISFSIYYVWHISTN